MRAHPLPYFFVGLALLLSGCGSGEVARAPSPIPPPYAGSGAVSAAPSVSATAYLSNAASIDLFEIRSANVALQRSSNPRIREFAKMMLAAHRGTSSQLSLAGRRLNLLPGANLNARHEAMMAQLVAASDFDAAYRRLQIEIHEEALALHRAFVSRGASPTLRPVALNAVPIIERHLRILRTL